MPRSLGGLQRVIEALLLEHNGPLQFAQIRAQLALTKRRTTSQAKHYGHATARLSVH